MAEQPQAETRLRAFVGELFSNPAPSECSFNECTRCSYCFARTNGRSLRKIDPGPTLTHIARVLRTGGNPINLADRLLAARHPVVVSNAVDPLFPANLQSTRAVLQLLQKAGVPVIFQTRGTDKPKDFAQYLDLLPDESVLYCSLTTESEEARRQSERGAPTHEERCEMMAMAVERGIPVVAALNPIDQTLVGDLGRFFDTIDRVVGADNVDGAWIAPLHLSRTQLANIRARSPQGLPVLFEEAVERASARPWQLRYGPDPEAPDRPYLDRYFYEDLFRLVDERSWRRYCHELPDLNKGRADLFDVWPRKFPTHHFVVQACQELSEQNGGAPVLVSFEAFCSWMLAPFKGTETADVLDWEIRRKDVWFWLNARQNVDPAERQAIVKSLSLREGLAYHWLHPETRSHAVWGAYGLKPVYQLDDFEFEVPIDGVYLREPTHDGDELGWACYAPDRGLKDEHGHIVHDPRRKGVFTAEIDNAVILPTYEEMLAGAGGEDADVATAALGE